MDYEKKYKEALERAKSLIGDTIIEESGQHIAEVIFPELKESENEKIRKAIHIYLDWLDGRKDCQPKGDYTIKDMIAWLERQGEQKPILNVPTREVILSIWDLGNEWKELTNGCISTKYGTQLDYIQKHWQENEYYLREKQGEQKVNYTTLAETGNGGINALVTREVYANDYEEKPVGKVEPKFHEGEWIVQENIGTYKVIEVCESWYEVIDVEDNHYSIAFDKEYMCHLWTIQDAKDGDVLCDITNKNVLIFNEISDGWVKCLCSVHLDDNCCLNCTELYGREEQCSFAPATKEQRDLLFQKMKEAGYEWDADKKELKKISQRMISAEAKEAMYAKPAWSEEDEVKINRIVACLENLNVADNDILLKDVDWLKSLKDRVQPQPNQEWSEEDEKIAKTIINEFEQSSEWYCANGLTKEDCIAWVNKQMHTKWSEEDKKKVNNLYVLLDQMVSFNMLSNKDATEFKDWLKSLRPQNRWKPTKQQLSELRCVISGCSFETSVLVELEKNLKKLL